MRLWHQFLLKRLPRQQLLGQHRECCALRGLGWGKKHSTVDYVFKYNPMYLIVYHKYVMAEMSIRGYKVDPKWIDSAYRGKRCLAWDVCKLQPCASLNIVFKEHDEYYYQECLDNLERKGIHIE